MSSDLRTHVTDRFRHGIQRASDCSADSEYRIGAELKFPLVNPDGSAAPRQALADLWEFLGRKGWEPEVDSLTGSTVGARRPGPRNDTVASFETGYCKPEFSLAHVGDLHELAETVAALRTDLAAFSAEANARFLAYGIQPVTAPGRDLLMRKARSSFWDKAMPSNQVIPPERGDDVHLFTVNAASHVHLNPAAEDAVRLVNVLNGFAGAQIALMANSSVWCDRVDQTHCCVAEKLWDWWKPATGRCGVPERAFEDLPDYVSAIGGLPPVYVKRDGQPLVLKRYETCLYYLSAAPAVAEDLNGEAVEVTPSMADLDRHNSCYWYCARISRYYTVENRVCDQQPPGEFLTVAALTLGLAANAGAARDVLDAYSWEDLREARRAACEAGLAARAGGVELRALCDAMVTVANEGLKDRGRGEERFLAPLFERMETGINPAAAAAETVRAGGIPQLVEARSIG